MKSRSKTLGILLPAIGTLSLVYGVVLVIANRPERPPELPPRAPTSAPVLSDSGPTAFIGATGILEPAGETILIAPHVAGVVASVSVSLGQSLKAGDLLFQIDSRRAEARWREAEQGLAVALMELEFQRSAIGPLAAELQAAEASLQAARALLSAAETDLLDRQNSERIAEAVQDARAISTEERDRRRFAALASAARVQQAKAEVAAAEAALVRAREQLRQYRRDSGEDGPRLLAERARVELAKAAAVVAKTEVDLHSVTAPTDAVVSQINLRVGEFAPAGVSANGLIQLARRPYRVRAQIDEADIPRFALEARAYASPRGAAQRRIGLKGLFVEPLVVPKTVLAGRASELIDTRVLEVIFEVEGDASGLVLGQQLDLSLEAARDAL